ncbi:MAG: precorrin-6y C5,15-methyltransferase (decarboxylating) subunit CbiE [Gammaproteobacteria bacterium]|nr:precorrin-6y C5,15-methyltransferase (decarboxylating) subunit CbiE [Gammaproteobacteria bacterium]MDH5727886.1 precorrin-6y C5,15-methyltransferase (decarboxylating) subunit CbiE [Gammaproteobacteria bacterium]
MSNINILGITPGSVIEEAFFPLITNAKIIIGASRHLDILPTCSAKKIKFPSPFDDLFEILSQFYEHEVLILATGDPNFYGVADWLRQKFPQRLQRVYPGISSMQLAFAKANLAWQDANFISLHGRPISKLSESILANNIYGILTDSKNTPSKIAQQLVELGFAEAEMIVVSAIGYENETIEQGFTTDFVSKSDFHALNIVIVQTGSCATKQFFIPGIDDEEFFCNKGMGDGLLTKKPIRLNIIAALAPQPGEIAWDIGAGCGGVCIEWAKFGKPKQLFAIEQREDVTECLQQNIEKFALQDTIVSIHAEASECLHSLPHPDKVFIGGSGDHLKAILDIAWQQLKPQGRLVLTSVTESTRSIIFDFCRNKSALWTEIQTSTQWFPHEKMKLQKRPVLIVQLDKD